MAPAVAEGVGAPVVPDAEEPDEPDASAVSFGALARLQATMQPSRRGDKEATQSSSLAPKEPKATERAKHARFAQECAL